MIGHSIDDLSQLRMPGGNAYSNRMLQEYYRILQTQGQAAADMVYDAYNAAGRFTGPTTLDRGADVLKAIRNNPQVIKAGQYLDEAAAPIASGLQGLADKIPLGKGGALATRMAGSKVGAILSKALPVLGAVGAVTDVGDILTNETTLANKAMDAAAMGIGGTIGGVIGLGNPFVAAAGASLGKMASDGTQFLFGGGQSPEERKLREALALLQGGTL